MRWTKLKQHIEDLFSPTIRGRVERHCTWYREGGRSSSRLWITISSLKTAMAEMRLAFKIAEENLGKAHMDENPWDSLRKDVKEARPILEKQGLYTFEQATRRSCKLPIDLLRGSVAGGQSSDEISGRPRPASRETQVTETAVEC